MHIEHNAPNSVQNIKNKEFADVKEDVSEAVQFRPQELNVDLRYDDPVNITIYYRPAKHFPLDIYYLMDLTWSMQPDLDTLKSLGFNLTDHLKKLTKNYRIAFGSYIDKPEMPYYLNDPTNKDNPCFGDGGTCEKGYLFKHRINFTHDGNMFVEKVKESYVSANLDDLESGMDAVMQILVCGEKVGWLGNSRKLILVATDGGMHLAGDGILGGYTKRNIQECMLDDDGNYMLLEHYDYPSLAEIHTQLKKKKTNIIVAAKSNIHSYYKKMADVLKEAIYVGELQTNSTNVLQLVDQGYYSFITKVNLFTSNIEGLEVDFFADCDGNGQWLKKSNCTNAEENKEMSFIVQLRLEKYQDKEFDVLYIEESNIQEKIKINLHYIGNKCTCSNLTKVQEESCDHGELNCGECTCDKGWAGDDCSKICINDYDKCRDVDSFGNLIVTCYGRGECICSRCICNSILYQGEYCQFDCPFDTSTKQVCGGHGICKNGTCHCEKEYVGETCTCHDSTEKCKIPGYDGSDSMCSGKGSCNCNKCECEIGYIGTYCEYCEGCTGRGLCKRYEQIVIDHVHKNNTENKYVRIEEVDLPALECRYDYTTDEGMKCSMFYDYKVLETDLVVVRATKLECSKPLSAGLVFGLIIAAFVVLLLLIIIIWKGRNIIRDRREYQQFLTSTNQTRHSESNPLYKNPVVTYLNPMEQATIHSKRE